MHLDISADEAAVLVDVLDRALRDTREEVYKAEIAEYKDALKKREAIIAGLRRRLTAPSPLT